MTVPSPSANDTERAYAKGRKDAADIAASLGYGAAARAILAGGDPEKLEALFDERARTLVAPTVGMREALASLVAERARQDAKFPGVRDPFQSGPSALKELYNDTEALLFDVRGTADDPDAPVVFAFLEEVLEVVTESNPENLAVELIQAAAIAIKWMESLAKRKSQ